MTPFSTMLARFHQGLPKPVAVALSYLVSLAAGVLIAVVLHYVLYRLGLPTKPFIYVVF